jgi:hypothetical protein
MTSIIPTVPEVSHEALKIIGGLLLAAFILSRFPKVRDFVAGQSISVKDGAGKALYF